MSRYSGTISFLLGWTSSKGTLYLRGRVRKRFWMGIMVRVVWWVRRKGQVHQRRQNLLPTRKQPTAAFNEVDERIDLVGVIDRRVIFGFEIVEVVGLSFLHGEIWIIIKWIVAKMRIGEVMKEIDLVNTLRCRSGWDRCQRWHLMLGLLYLCLKFHLTHHWKRRSRKH